MVLFKKLLLGAVLLASATGKATCASYWAYMHHNATAEFIYLVANPNYVGSKPWWDCPEGLLIQGFPNVAAPFVVVTDSRTGHRTSGLSTISFITRLDSNGNVIPGGADAAGTCRLALALMPDGVTVGLRDITNTDSLTANCLWQIIPNGGSGVTTVNSVQPCSIMVPRSNVAATGPLYMTFQNGLTVQNADLAGLSGVQFMIPPPNLPAGSLIYNGASGASPLKALDGLAGLPRPHHRENELNQN